MATQKPVEVLFVDADSHDEIARSAVPGDQLPESFDDASTTVELQGVPWTVVAAEPPHASLFRESGRLVLQVRRQQFIDPQTILFSLPTICDALPQVAAPDDAALVTDRLVLHEDDWRQIELVSAAALPAVERELAQIREVFEQHTHRATDGALVGFTRTHVRVAPTEPLSGSVSWTALLRLCPAPGHQPGTVGFLGTDGIVARSFVVPIGPGNLYGVAGRDDVHILGLDLDDLRTPADAAGLASALDPVMREFGLLLVAWCQTAVITAEQLSEFLDQLIQ